MSTVDAMDTIGILCTVVVGFWILKFVLGVIYKNFLATALGINAVNLRETGKWAGKYLIRISLII